MRGAATTSRAGSTRAPYGSILTWCWPPKRPGADSRARDTGATCPSTRSMTTPGPSTSCTTTAADPTPPTPRRKALPAMPTHTYAVPPISYATYQPSTNWGGNQTCTPAFTVSPRNEQEVLDVVRFAIKQNLPVRAVGAGHSFTPIVTTGGVLINTDALTGVTDVDLARNRVRLRGGTRLKDIGDPLWERGLSLTNQGDIVEQSISGALATATHGSGIRQQSFSGRLRWARIVNGHGEIVEVGEDDMNKLLAAQVAIGTLGIMTEVELEASPRYYLE